MSSLDNYIAIMQIDIANQFHEQYSKLQETYGADLHKTNMYKERLLIFEKMKLISERQDRLEKDKKNGSNLYVAK